MRNAERLVSSLITIHIFLTIVKTALSMQKLISFSLTNKHQGINKINKWAIINGFRISKTKTQCMHFCQLRKMYNNPTLKLDRSEILVVDQYKFLCVIFDKKLSFIPHLQILKVKCSKALKLLCIVAHKDGGADQQTLLKLYRILIHFKIDYGCYIYWAARKSYLKSVNTVHHEGLRLILGAFRTSPSGKPLPWGLWTTSKTQIYQISTAVLH